MITNIIDLLQQKDYYKVSKDIDIAKGKYKAPITYKELKQRLQRYKTYN